MHRAGPHIELEVAVQWRPHSEVDALRRQLREGCVCAQTITDAEERVPTPTLDA